jgi:hypothetical protein
MCWRRDTRVLSVVLLLLALLGYVIGYEVVFPRRAGSHMSTRAVGL